MNIVKRLSNLPGFFLFFMKEVILSNIRVAADVLTPQDKSRPAIIAMSLPELNDNQVFMLSSMITMTPGTLSLDLSEDRRTIYIHAMYLYDRAAFEHDVTHRYVRMIKRIL